MSQSNSAALESLRAQIREVREHIVALVTLMDDIMLQQIPQIKADYMMKIGCWEKALVEAELAGRRAKRRLTLAQAQANRGKEPQLDAIDAQLDTELAQWMAQAEHARIQYEQALSYIAGTTPLSPRDATKMKSLYRTLVKRLHPDVCHTANEEGDELFLVAQAAYKNGNIEMLASLEVATRHMDPAHDDLEAVNDEALLAQELELARIEESAVEGRLRDLEDCEEMRLGKQLANPEWVSQTVFEMRQAVEEWERVRDDCNKRLALITGASNEH